MSRLPSLYQWEEEITRHMPNLSKPQIAVLALWSLGMILCKSCGLTSVANHIAGLLGQKEDTVKKRLKEWCYKAEDKKGKKRREIPLRGSFPFLLGWVLNLWKGSQLAIAMDASNLSDKFVVLAISVVYRGCAIPVAWTILRADQKRAWKQEWLGMLDLFKSMVSSEKMVIVMADRGLYAKWLFKKICELGWHPFLRINSGGKFHSQEERYWKRISEFAPLAGTRWSGEGSAFKSSGSRLKCTLLAFWGEEAKEPWFILTDLPPDACNACWYATRFWIEHGFKITKRGGWQWNHTRMEDPDRASRLWLAISVATLWTVSVGGEAEESLPESTFEDMTGMISFQKIPWKATKKRSTSVFKRGLMVISNYLILGNPLPYGRFYPEPWPNFINTG